MQAGDPAERKQGWEAWYRRDAQCLLHFLQQRCRALGCPDQAEDLLQDCFVIGFRNVASGAFSPSDKPLGAYLVGIAKNLLRELYRARQRGLADLDEEVAASSSGVEPEDSLFVAEVVGMVRAAAAQGPDVYRQVLAGMYAEGKSSHQLAAELGKNAGNVRAIAHRGVREIGRHLERQHSMHLSAEAIRACLEVI
jgi:RNA polymerase sigma-70 factor (ECF subfamily)